MVKPFLKKILLALGFEPAALVQQVGQWSIRRAVVQDGLDRMMGRLAEIVPDISDQYSREEGHGDYWHLKVRAQQAFQATLMLKVLDNLPARKIVVVDIGDSAGTHMTYLANLVKDERQVETISVNLDPRAVAKISAKGLKAVLCRAEDLDLGQEQPVDLFTSFEMVEHLHNPALFFYRLAKRSSCRKILITVPYLKTSRVGLHHVRLRSSQEIFAEDEHIFELSPEDWTLLLLHSGWKISHSEVYYQYPRKWPIISQLLAYYWKTMDYEGFWGAILEKDLTFANRYQDWEERDFQDKQLQERHG
jgi:hypothetical protein